MGIGLILIGFFLPETVGRVALQAGLTRLGFAPLIIGFLRNRRQYLDLERSGKFKVN